MAIESVVKNANARTFKLAMNSPFEWASAVRIGPRLHKEIRAKLADAAKNFVFKV